MKFNELLATLKNNALVFNYKDLKIEISERIEEDESTEKNQAKIIEQFSVSQLEQIYQAVQENHRLYKCEIGLQSVNNPNFPEDLTDDQIIKELRRIRLEKYIDCYIKTKTEYNNLKLAKINLKLDKIELDMIIRKDQFKKILAELNINLKKTFSFLRFTTDQILQRFNGILSIFSTAYASNSEPNHLEKRMEETQILAEPTTSEPNHLKMMQETKEQIQILEDMLLQLKEELANLELLIEATLKKNQRI